MTDPVVILSDTHFGHPGASAGTPAALRPLWQGASRLIINGDVAEVHHPEFRVQAAHAVMELQDLCAADGVELILLSGNHDPYISDRRHVHLHDRVVLVTHGDALHPAVAPWSPAAGRMRAAYDAAMSCIPASRHADLAARLSVFQFASHEEWIALAEEMSSGSTIRKMLRRPWAFVQVLRYWAAFPRLAARFVRELSPESSYVIMGHTHRPGIWDVDGLTVINTGSYAFPGRPRAVRLDGRTMSVWRIHRDGAVFRPASSPLKLYALPPLADGGAHPSALNTRAEGVRPSTAEICWPAS